MLKKMIVIVSFIIVGFVGCAGRVSPKKDPIDELYARGAVVTEIHHVDWSSEGSYIIQMEDSVGFTWECYDDAEDWAVGDIACMILKPSGKDQTIRDDEIVSIHYSGYWEY